MLTSDRVNGESRRGVPLTIYLAAYGLIIALPALIFGTFLLSRYADLERSRVAGQIQNVAATLADNIDRELSNNITTLSVLASSNLLETATLGSFHARAAAALSGTDDFVLLLDADAQQLVNTRVPYGTVLGKSSDPSLAQIVDSRPYVTGIFFGEIASAYVFNIVYPVFRGGDLRYILILTRNGAKVADWLALRNVDPPLSVLVVDGNGVVMFQSANDGGYAPGTVLPDRFRELTTAYGSNWSRWTDETGEEFLIMSNATQLADWSVVLRMPVAAFNETADQTWLLLSVGGAILLALTVLLAFLFGRNLSEPVSKLVKGADALGRGELVHPIDSSIREVRAVGDALAHASQTRRQMEQSLRAGEDRLRLALASASTGAWDWNLVTGALTWDHRMHELWGLPPDAPVTFETFLNALHPDDRAPTLEAIKAAQDPHQPVEYDVEYRVKGVRDGAERWVAAKGGAHFADGKAVRMAGTARDITERKHWEEHTQLLMREITHRSKNLLAVIQAMARQTRVGSRTVADFEARFSDRLQALAASHDLLVQRDWHGVPIADLVNSQLAHYLDQHASQIEISGQKMIVTPEAAQNIGLAVHELSTNAAKYGALSVPGGAVQVEWACSANGDGEPRFQMTWSERGGPPVSPPEQRGFGQVVMEQLTARALQGTADLQFHPEGVRWTLDIPASHILWQEDR